MTERNVSPRLRALGETPLQPDDTMSEAGRKVLAYHFVRLLEKEPHVREVAEVEAIHEMRVATRRLRSALRIFAPFYRAQTIKPFRKALRTLADMLGAARDLDVFREHAEAYAAPYKTRQKALRGLKAALLAQAEAARKPLREWLASAQHRTFVDSFAQFLLTTDNDTLPTNPDVPHRVREVAPALIYTSYGHVRAYESALSDLDLTRLHSLRIEVKRLRYLLEAFSEVLGTEVKTVIEACKHLQDFLGEVQDARVAVAMLEDHLKNETANKQAIARYREQCAKEQSSRLKGVKGAWQAYTAPEIRQALALAVAHL